MSENIFRLLRSTSVYFRLQHRRGPGYLGDGLAQGPLGTVDRKRLLTEPLMFPYGHSSSSEGRARAQLMQVPRLCHSVASAILARRPTIPRLL